MGMDEWDRIRACGSQFSGGGKDGQLKASAEQVKGRGYVARNVETLRSPLHFTGSIPAEATGKRGVADTPIVDTGGAGKEKRESKHLPRWPRMKCP
jgi:hypothetical protein